MHLLIAFALLFALALVVLALMDGYARHMGNSGPSDWVAMATVAALVAAGATGVFAFAWEVFGFVWRLLS